MCIYIYIYIFIIIIIIIMIIAIIIIISIVIIIVVCRAGLDGRPGGGGSGRPNETTIIVTIYSNKL